MCNISLYHELYCSGTPASVSRRRLGLDDRKYSTVSLSEELEQASTPICSQPTDRIDQLESMQDGLVLVLFFPLKCYLHVKE